ncbi:hypothetical protein EDB84DRAFT_1510883, partial [Lactarius hengduanensis]
RTVHGAWKLTDKDTKSVIGESKSGMFGNSNWRGPIWRPLAVNLLLIENLQRFHQYCGDELQ